MAVEGDLRSALAQHREAAAAYDEAFDVAPSFALALRSASARSAAKLPEPARSLTRWVASHPDDAGARVALAEALVRDGEPARAAEQLRAVLATRPQDVTALNNLAWIYHELGDPRALGLARQAAALAPNVPQVADTLGWILVEQGQASEGVPLLERAAGSRSASPSIRYHYGAALARTGATERSRQLLTELLADEASFPERTAAAGLLADLSKGEGSGK
jgi:Flp pilus assembly protein TadD